MPRWTVDELRATLTRLQDPSRPSPLADRLGIDALRLRSSSEEAGDRSVYLHLVTRTGVRVGGVLVELEYGITEATQGALETLAPFGIAQDRCAIYWNFWVMEDRRGEGLGFLLAAAGAAWAADRGYAITGGAGLSSSTTSEAARSTYRKLAALLPHVLLPGGPDWATVARPTFVVSAHPSGLQLPLERALYEADISRIRQLNAWLYAEKPRVVVQSAKAKILALGGDERLLRKWAEILQEFPAEDRRVAALRTHVDLVLFRAERNGTKVTTYASSLPVLYGGPLKGVLTGNLGLNP